MSTRAVTITKENGEVKSLYKHWDGYPSNIVPNLQEQIEDYNENGCKGSLTDHIKYEDGYENYKENIPRITDNWVDGYLTNDVYSWFYEISNHSIKVMRPFYNLNKGHGLLHTKEVNDWKPSDKDYETCGRMMSEWKSINDEYKELDDQDWKDLSKEDQIRKDKLFNMMFFTKDSYHNDPSMEKMITIEYWVMKIDKDTGQYVWCIQETIFEKDWINSEQHTDQQYINHDHLLHYNDYGDDEEQGWYDDDEQITDGMDPSKLMEVSNEI